ncbi:hypothetical protein DICVIV_12479 [Dictyocaulus viviparus]|uniref:N-acetyltransferase domain-containing protein n=1 Tax=Dictyocaulus viviparus TaxID=29172 RepID=A0A0D8XD12_DICVI|nr:hypothetical protein DICVIV_12479 [Dictyocaulus viviparus]
MIIIKVILKYPVLQAQGLKRVLTTYEKVLNHPEEQVIYLMWHRHPTKSSSSIVVGMLKIGRKHLYLLDENQKKYEEEPLCILDFYIHNSVQRKGNGHKLFEFMLKQEATSAISVAIDRPSEALLQFLTKFYGLKKPVWQSTNFVVFPEFFDGKVSVESGDRKGCAGHSEKLISRPDAQPYVERGASKSTGKDSVAGILHGDLTAQKQRIVGPDTPLDRKNRRDFGHQSLW